MESPLEVLSRAAATMVQEKTSEAKLPNKELPTTKWRRERRRLSEYQTQSSSTMVKNGTESGEAPLDMTITSGTKPRSPPPYREPLPGSTFALSFARPTVITQAPKTQLRLNSVSDHLPESISMCDTVIDEHFRRSLGNNYMALFSKNGDTKEDIAEDAISLSVDDHFAKALGDTWQKIKATSEPSSGTKRRDSGAKSDEESHEEDKEEVVAMVKEEIEVEEGVDDGDSGTTSSSSCKNSQVTS